jgi:hypothetical protein
MKLALAAASLVLVAGGAAGCGDDGGGGSSDKTASTKDFCGAFQSFYDDLTSVADDDKNLGKVLKDAAKKIRDVGTPKGIPGDAKDGLEITLDAIDELPDDASAEDISKLDSKFSDDDKKKTDAFSSYLDKTCPDIGTGS